MFCQVNVNYITNYGFSMVHQKSPNRRKYSSRCMLYKLCCLCLKNAQKHIYTYKKYIFLNLLNDELFVNVNHVLSCYLINNKVFPFPFSVSFIPCRFPKGHVVISISPLLYRFCKLLVSTTCSLLLFPLKGCCLILK